jgi:hypothetical protein
MLCTSLHYGLFHTCYIANEALALKSALNERSQNVFADQIQGSYLNQLLWYHFLRLFLCSCFQVALEVVEKWGQ